VLQVQEDLERLADYLVRSAPIDVDDEADAASVVLESRIVKTLLWGRTVRRHIDILENQKATTLSYWVMAFGVNPNLNRPSPVRAKQRNDGNSQRLSQLKKRRH